MVAILLISVGLLLFFFLIRRLHISSHGPSVLVIIIARLLLMLMRIGKTQLIELGATYHINNGKLMSIEDDHVMIIIAEEYPFGLELVVKLYLLIAYNSI